MNTLTIAYLILAALEYHRGEPITAESLGIRDEERFNDVMQDLICEGYADTTNGRTRITLKGARYLEENPVMRTLENTLERGS